MSETMSERMEKRSCDNKYYIPNLTTALKRAVQQKDVDAIITYAGELERFKVLCGFTPAIQQFEESLKHFGRELGLLDQPEIKRALATIPRKRCYRCNCEEPRHREGFIAMLESSHPTTSEKQEEPQEPSHSEFQRMLSASGKNNQPTIERQIIPIEFASQFPDVCDPDKCPPNYARHCRANRQENWGKECIYVTIKNR